MARFLSTLCIVNNNNKSILWNMSGNTPFLLNFNAHICICHAVLLCQVEMLSLSQANKKTTEVSGPSKICTSQDF